MAKAVMPTPQLISALEKALGIDAAAVRRVVIDIKAGECPTVYIEQHGDEKLLAVVEALSSVQVKLNGKD